jgi:putative transposase
VSERTVWRWLAEPGVGERDPQGYRLSGEDIAELVSQRGNVSAVWRARHAGGVGPSLRTLQRAVGRDLRPGDRAAMVEGAEGRRRHQVYLRWEPSHRNEIWEADHKELEVLVRPPRCQRGQKPWVTLFLDAFSRLIMGWAIALSPSAATVLAALGKGIRLDPERGPFGGVPSVLRWDNGLEFAAASIKAAAGALGCAALPTAAYSPHLKGKMERANRTVTQDLLGGLPFYTNGPRAVDGRLYGPDAPPMSLGTFVGEFDRWVRHYNTERPHAGLGGQTPLARWEADATPLQVVPDADLRWLMLAGEARTVLKDGIHFHGLAFIAPELNGRVGQKVEVRHVPHDDRRIEVFIDGRWLATARPQNALTEAERDRVLAQRRADAAEQGRRQRQASRSARARLAAMTEPGEPEVTTVIPAGTGRVETGRVDDLALRRQARTGLLGLGEEAPGPG